MWILEKLQVHSALYLPIKYYKVFGTPEMQMISNELPRHAFQLLNLTRVAPDLIWFLEYFENSFWPENFLFWQHLYGKWRMLSNIWGWIARDGMYFTIYL